MILMYEEVFIKFMCCVLVLKELTAGQTKIEEQIVANRLTCPYNKRSPRQSSPTNPDKQTRVINPYTIHSPEFVHV